MNFEKDIRYKFRAIPYPIDCDCGGKAIAHTTKLLKCEKCKTEYRFSSPILPSTYHPDFPYPEIETTPIFVAMQKAVRQTWLKKNYLRKYRRKAIKNRQRTHLEHSSGNNSIVSDRTRKKLRPDQLSPKRNEQTRHQK